MKKIVLILLLLSITKINAQFNEYKYGKVYFKDGTEKWGFIKFKDLDKIKFKKETNNKTIIYGHKDIKKLHNDYDYEYVLIDDKQRLLKVELKGKINLFSYDYSSIYSLSGINMPYQIGTSYGTVYYIEHNGAIFYTKRKFKKDYDFIIANCAGLKEKLKERELKRKQLKKIIKYFNERCD